MAIIYPGIVCPICSTAIDTRSKFFATSGVFFPPEHRLYAFCDAAIHWDCYASWQDRPEFARGYLQMWSEVERHNPFWGKALLSEEVLVAVNPSRKEVSVRLAETGSGFRVSLDFWEHWIEEGWGMAAAEYHPMEKHALSRVMPLLRTVLPTAQSLLEPVDWEAKRQLHQEMDRQAAEARARKSKRKSSDPQN